MVFTVIRRCLRCAHRRNGPRCSGPGMRRWLGVRPSLMRRQSRRRWRHRRPSRARRRPAPGPRRPGCPARGRPAASSVRPGPGQGRIVNSHGISTGRSSFHAQHPIFNAASSGRPSDPSTPRTRRVGRQPRTDRPDLCPQAMSIDGPTGRSYRWLAHVKQSAGRYSV
jgi:hypothetical protein